MPARPITDEQLINLVLDSQKGSTEAFGKIYDHYFDSVYRYIAFRLPEELAEDMVAEVFVKAWEKLHTYKPQKKVPFGAWLFRIARHSVIDAYRTRKTVEEVPEDTEDTDELNRAETRVKRQHLLKTVRKAMGQLPSRYREVLHLSYMAELPNGEVARVMRTSEGSVRTLKSRALKKLQEYLPPDFS